MNKNGNIPALLILSGPTASGKSTLAESLAMEYNLPVISADSRQVYRKFDIGTAKPSLDIRSRVRYEMIDILDPEEPFSAGKFAKRAAKLIDHKYRDEPVIIIAGGTGFYIKALIDGLADIPEISPDIQLKWDKKWQDKGIEFLQKEIEILDPVYIQKGDLYNPHRLLRALKVIDQTGLSIYDYEPESFLTRKHPIVYFSLHHDRKDLYDRINQRVDDMINQGLVEEVRSLLPYQNSPAMRTVGYKELISYFQGQVNLRDAIEKIKQHSRNYAKRQVTWLKKHGDWTWIDPPGTEQVRVWIEQYL